MISDFYLNWRISLSTGYAFPILFFHIINSPSKGQDTLMKVQSILPGFCIHNKKWSVLSCDLTYQTPRLGVIHKTNDFLWYSTSRRSTLYKVLFGNSRWNLSIITGHRNLNWDLRKSIYNRQYGHVFFNIFPNFPFCFLTDLLHGTKELKRVNDTTKNSRQLFPKTI